jgi:hypothetical protein
MTAAEAIEVWPPLGEFRCLIPPCADRWELALMRQHLIIKVDRFIDPAAALTAADEWRRAIALSEDEGSSSAPRCR